LALFLLIKYGEMKYRKYKRTKKTMSENKHKKQNIEQEPAVADVKSGEETAEAQVIDVMDADDAGAEDSAECELSEVDELKQKLAEANQALEKEKKEYLFLMADFDNYRKRVLKEKAELIKNGAEKAFKALLPVVDDFERGLEATKTASDADALRQGMELIYNKLVKYLADNGVKAMDTENVDFDADVHEAVAIIDSPTPEQKGKIIDTTQKGYTINDKVLRHAKVVVGQ